MCKHSPDACIALQMKQQGEQQLDVHRQWAVREKELALKEAEARNNHANTLAAAAADSAWQYTVQMERWGTRARVQQHAMHH
jgi:hypothetical protein